MTPPDPLIAAIGQMGIDAAAALPVEALARRPTGPYMCGQRGVRRGSG